MAGHAVIHGPFTRLAVRNAVAAIDAATVAVSQGLVPAGVTESFIEPALEEVAVAAVDHAWQWLVSPLIVLATVAGASVVAKVTNTLGDMVSGLPPPDDPNYKQAVAQHFEAVKRSKSLELECVWVKDDSPRWFHPSLFRRQFGPGRRHRGRRLYCA